MHHACPLRIPLCGNKTEMQPAATMRRVGWKLWSCSHPPRSSREQSLHCRSFSRGVPFARVVPRVRSWSASSVTLGPLAGPLGPPAGQKIRAFFFLLPPPISLFLLSLGVFFVELWPRFKAVAHPNCTFVLFRGHFVRAPCCAAAAASVDVDVNVGVGVCVCVNVSVSV